MDLRERKFLASRLNLLPNYVIVVSLNTIDLHFAKTSEKDGCHIYTAALLL